MSELTHSSPPVDRQEEARFALRTLIVAGGAERLGNYAWIWESARWRELVFALLAQIAHSRNDELHELTVRLEALGLLDVKGLAALAGTAEAPGGARDVQARRIVEALRNFGFDEEQARRGLAAIADTALAVQTRFEGKIHRYLRLYGERMLDELGDTFHFTSLTPADAADAFTYWLQNVLCMPLSLVDANVRRVAAEHALEPADLVRAADEMNLNLAFLDDLAAVRVGSVASGATAAGAGGRP